MAKAEPVTLVCSSKLARRLGAVTLDAVIQSDRLCVDASLILLTDEGMQFWPLALQRDKLDVRRHA